MLGLFWRGGLLTDIPYARTCMCEHECSYIEREREREAGGRSWGGGRGGDTS